jgi:hypothetical protein
VELIFQPVYPAEEMMKSFVRLVGCLFLFLLGGQAFGGQTVSIDKGWNEQKTVDAMRALTARLENPLEAFRPNDVRNGMRFDPMSFFTVLKNISLPEGKIIDYVYRMESSAGYPLLYVRNRDQKSYRGRDGYLGFVREGMMDRLVRDLVVGDQPAGYFEYAVFYLMAPNFYLHKWAKTNLEVVCHEARLREILEDHNQIPMPAIQAAKKLDLAPRIVLSADKVEVRLVTFTAWGGFFAEDFIISRSAPHTLLQHDKKCLVEYNCGILF